jgi:hypothetical protein
MTFDRFRTGGIIFLLAVLVVPVRAEELLVPGDTQLRILQKVWTLDRAFPHGRTPRVVILYQSKYKRSARVVDELLSSEAGKAPAMKLVPVDLSSSIPIAEQIPDSEVVYLAPLRSVEISSVIRVTRARGMRTVTAVADYVTEGVGLGIVLDDDLPRIMVNLDASLSEGADYSAQLLKLANVLRGRR